MINPQENGYFFQKGRRKVREREIREVIEMQEVIRYLDRLDAAQATMSFCSWELRP